MFCRRTAFAAFVVAFSLLSCSRTPGGVERLAILPIENLTSSAGLDWVSHAASAVLAYDLTGPRGIRAIRTETLRDARLSGATRYLEGYFDNEHGALAFHLSIEDPAARKFTGAMSLSAPLDDIVAAMNRAAKDLDSRARAAAGCKGAALQPTASQADPHCMPVYLPWAESLLARGDREGAARAASAGLAASNSNAIDHAQLEYISATARGEDGARLAALQRLAALLPADPQLLRDAAELQLARRDFHGAAQSLEAAVRANAGDSAAWNLLGYVRADLRDLNGAREALEHYEQLAPEDPNALDSLGEVSFYLGDFARAERYFLDAQRKNPSGEVDLLKAAEARMITGDLAGADRLLAQRTWSGLDQAEWEFVTGRRKQAMARLQQMQADPRAALQLALWRAQTGEGPAPRAGNDPLSRAVSLLLAGQFAPATPLLEQVYGATNPAADGQIRTLLAWSYARTGRPDAAAKLLDLYPIPLGGSGDNPILAALTFPRFVELRGEILHSQKDRQLAAKYAGDAPDQVK